MVLNDYLALDFRKKENILPITQYVLALLKNYRESHYEADMSEFVGVITKFCYMTDHYLGNMNNEIIQLAKRLVNTQIGTDGEATDSSDEKYIRYKVLARDLYAFIMTANEQIILSQLEEISLDAFQSLYIPHLADKKTAASLIKEAILILNDDTTIKGKAKKQIISQLNRALDLLTNEKTNWTMFFGLLRETILVLGACGSILSGVAGGLYI
jgi:hypothetical protein